VGNNHLFCRAIDAIARWGNLNPIHRTTPLGFIPVGAADNSLAAYLGIAQEELAGDILSARRIEPLDLGRAGDRYFLTAATIATTGTAIEIDGQYTVTIREPGEVFVVNLPLADPLRRIAPADPTDGKLELCIRTEPPARFRRRRDKTVTRLPFNELMISNPSVPLVIDGTTSVPTPARVRIAPDQVRMIVGKHRALMND
jgi:diacylglycerol kinase family enzyme